MCKVFYIPLAMSIALLLGGLAPIFALLVVVFVKKPSLPLPRLFFPPLRTSIKIAIAELVFATAFMVVSLALHLMVYVSISED